MMKNKILAILMAFLMLTITISLVALPVANAHTPPWTINSYAYIDIAPNPIGVGQTTYISIWTGQVIFSAAVGNDIRRTNYTLTITKPNGQIITQHWDVIQDTTGIQFTSFTPDQIGNYTLKFDYGGQIYRWSGTYQNDTILPSSKTTTLTVQEELIPAAIGSYPLPTEYWTYPIEGENTYWYTISSNWLRGGQFGAFQMESGLNLWQKDGIAPNSPHIMWTNPIEFGGVVPGNSTYVPGATYYSGGSYNGRFGNAIIMNGRLFFELPYGNSGSGGGYVSMDLRTGERLWLTNTTGIGTPSFGYLFYFDDENQHGVLPDGLLFTSNFARAYDPLTGIVTTMNITNSPSGTEVYGPSGEALRYQLSYTNRWLARWNSSKVVGTRSGTGVGGWYSGTVNASLESRYDWNVTTIPDLPGLSSPAIYAVLTDDIILGRSSSITAGVGGQFTSDPYTMWALSDKPNSRGSLLWIKNYTAPESGNLTRRLGPVDPINRVWTMYDTETMQWLGYSLDNGNLLWGPTTTPVRDMQFFGGGEGGGQRAVTAYGNVYAQGYGGELLAYSSKDGTLIWKFNNTYSGLQTPWGLRPIFIATIADGKVYAFNNEHSPNSPLYKDNKVYCLNATSGEQIWSMNSWAGQSGGPGTSTSVLADGFLVYYNYYDNSIFCIGKGPSATTIEAPKQAIKQGDSLVISGTVTDIAAGTQQHEQAARFPNGVPAVSDASQGQWMEYVYMQKPRPTNITGVPITISVVDANGNYREIGSVTSDADGFYSLNWKPDIDGKYTVYASFGGSDSYWPSHAVTAFAVDPAAPTASPTEAPTQSAADMYFVPAIVGLFIAIFVVGALLAILLIRKRP